MTKPSNLLEVKNLSTRFDLTEGILSQVYARVHAVEDISFEINADAEKLIEQIVDKYDLPDKSKAIRCLLDYVEEKESEWDEMFATIRCNRCG